MQSDINNEKVKILAEVLLTNLPNGFEINAGFREYNNELVMLSETADKEEIVIPVKTILDHLSQRYKKQNDTIEDMVESVGCLLTDIYNETQKERMLGFDGVCIYLYDKIDKNKTYKFKNNDERQKNISRIELTNHSDDLQYYIKHPLVSDEVIAKLELYRNGEYDKNEKNKEKNKKSIINKYNKQVLRSINSKTTDGVKYCFGCTYNLEPCSFSFKSILKRKRRRPSFSYKNNTFKDFKNKISKNKKSCDSKSSGDKEDISL